MPTRDLVEHIIENGGNNASRATKERQVVAIGIIRSAKYFSGFHSFWFSRFTRVLLITEGLVLGVFHKEWLWYIVSSGAGLMVAHYGYDYYIKHRQSRGLETLRALDRSIQYQTAESAPELPRVDAELNAIVIAPSESQALLGGNNSQKCACCDGIKHSCLVKAPSAFFHKASQTKGVIVISKIYGVVKIPAFSLLNGALVATSMRHLSKDVLSWPLDEAPAILLMTLPSLVMIILSVFSLLRIGQAKHFYKNTKFQHDVTREALNINDPKTADPDIKRDVYRELIPFPKLDSLLAIFKVVLPGVGLAATLHDTFIEDNNILQISFSEPVVWTIAVICSVFYAAYAAYTVYQEQQQRHQICDDIAMSLSAPLPSP